MVAMRLLVTMCVVLMAGSCQGRFESFKTKEAEDLFKRMFKVDQSPMSSEEVIAGLNKLIDEDLVNKQVGIYRDQILECLSATKITVDHCNSASLHRLDYRYESSKYDYFPEHHTLTNVAQMLGPKIDAIYQFCRKEYDAKFSKALNKLAVGDLNKLNDLARSMDLPHIYEGVDGRALSSVFFRDLTTFVQQRKTNDEQEFDQAYEMLVLEPCDKLDSLLGPVVRIGFALEAKQSFEEQDKLLFKAAKICNVARFKNKRNYDKHL